MQSDNYMWMLGCMVYAQAGVDGWILDFTLIVVSHPRVDGRCRHWGSAAARSELATIITAVYAAAVVNRSAAWFCLAQFLAGGKVVGTGPRTCWDQRTLVVAPDFECG